LLGGDKRNAEDWRLRAFAAWATGSIVAFIVEKQAPGLSTAISSALVAGIVYRLIGRESPLVKRVTN
jgi:cytosine permease